MNDTIPAIQEYFVSMMSHKVTSLTSMLTKYQEHVISQKENLSEQQMDQILNSLHDVSILLKTIDQ